MFRTFYKTFTPCIGILNRHTKLHNHHVMIRCAVGGYALLLLACGWYKRRCSRCNNKSNHFPYRRASSAFTMNNNSHHDEFDDDDELMTAEEEHHNRLRDLTVADVRKVFDAIADPHDQLDPEKFQEILETLGYQLGPETIERLFARLVSGRPVKPTNPTPSALISRSPSGKYVHRINFEQFMSAVRREMFMANVVSYYQKNRLYSIPADFDYTIATDVAYGTTNMEFFGVYKDIRETMDYSYHNNYTHDRQLWQDMVISNVVVKTIPQPRPWLVFSCGPMGAGKGYVLAWMSEKGILPLEDIIHLDADAFKQVMPEWRGYVKHNPLTAGTNTHGESCYMLEIAQEAALRQDQNVWVDASLRDGDWYVGVFNNIRERYPHYRLAICYVHASEERVRERIAHRARQTGRHIPEELIRASLHAPDHSLAKLTPKCDFVARIENNGRVPRLEAVETVDYSGNWTSILRRFHTVDDNFPVSLSPYFLKRCDLSECHIDVRYLDRQYIVITTTLTTYQLHCSRLHPTRLSDEMRDLANIPIDAESYVYLYPRIHVNNHHHIVEEKADGLSDLLTNAGGFMYLTNGGTVCAINSFTLKRSRNNALIQFGPQQTLTEKQLKRLNDWQPMRQTFMRKRGVKEFMWVEPGTFRSVPYGGFVYRFDQRKRKQAPIMFAVLGNAN